MSVGYTFDEAAAYEAYLQRLPEDGRARVAEPAAEDFKPPFPNDPTFLKCHLEAKDPVKDPSRFLLLCPGRVAPGNDDPTNVQVDWINGDANNRWTGGGIGFPDVTQRPRLRAKSPAPRRLPHFWPQGSYFIASPAVCELLRKYDSASIETLEIDWRYSNGVRLDGYAFLDVRTKRHSIDFLRSEFDITLNGERRYIRQHGHRTLRGDIPDSAHIFRDALDTNDVFVSRELAIELEILAPGECQFLDCQLGQDAQLTLERIRKQRSAFKKDATPASEQHELHEWIKSTALPLVRAGDFTAAERELVGYLRSIDPGPYHVVCDLEITTRAKDVARYMSEFVKLARSKHEVAAIYCEMNEFTINTDRWYYSAFGFSQDGGRDDFDWLGDFISWSEGEQAIEGLESLQTVFAESRIDQERGFEKSRILCELLVVVKFQKMLSEARPHMKKLEAPLLACAHEFYEYAAEIPRPPERRGWFSWGG